MDVEGWLPTDIKSRGVRSLTYEKFVNKYEDKF